MAFKKFSFSGNTFSKSMFAKCQLTECLFNQCKLEETEFLPMFEAVEPSLSGKLVALFGSYGWGDGEWMKNWEARIRAQGTLFAEGLILNEAPDAEGLEKCRAFGRDFGER